MSVAGYLIWFITTAVLVTLLLGFGIMKAAGIIGHKEPGRSRPEPSGAPDRPET